MDAPTIVGVITAVVLAAIIGYAIYQRYFRDNRDATTARVQAIIDSLVARSAPIAGQRPSILSRTPLAEPILAAIDAAFAERIATARARGWTSGLAPENYTVMVFPAVRETDSSGGYAPNFQVFFGAGDAYDGSIYDQEPNSPGGWTYAAEWVLADGNGQLSNVFVIAENNSPEYTQRVTSYGLDHLFAYYNDSQLYQATASHANGGGHPLW